MFSLKKITIITIGLVFQLFAQDHQAGALTNELLVHLNNSVKMDSYTKAMQNAVSGNEIKKLALNRELVGKIDGHFAHKIDVKGITNQKKSGRCWLFTGLNVLRPKVIKKYNEQ